MNILDIDTDQLIKDSLHLHFTSIEEDLADDGYSLLIEGNKMIVDDGACGTRSSVYYLDGHEEINEELHAEIEELGLANKIVKAFEIFVALQKF